MRLPQDQLRKAYYDLISGIIYQGNPLKVYDMNAPDMTQLDIEFKFVLIKEISSLQFLKRAGGVHRCRIGIDIVCGYTGNSGFMEAEQIGDLISQAVSPIEGEGLIMSDFNIHLTEMVGSINLFQDTTTHRVYRLILSFEHNVGQLV
jgi:hypothetical protein